ncbi:hypothetical protein F0562_020444 [Nyssa sinensis]|uniref:Uncharacterized protein n=1 Tax=Nyssa sinensis TaxID=561372 RepID=A0A5J5BT01_9ASTE|nr:hypothetical protein F0562_020444 [Nyssa sinensis]
MYLFVDDFIGVLDELFLLHKRSYIGCASQLQSRIPLDYLNGEKFREAVDNYIRPLLTKGVPSLFSDLSPLYDQAGKVDLLDFVFPFDYSKAYKKYITE